MNTNILLKKTIKYYKTREQIISDYDILSGENLINVDVQNRAHIQLAENCDIMYEGVINLCDQVGISSVFNVNEPDYSSLNYLYDGMDIKTAIRTLDAALYNIYMMMLTISPTTSGGTDWYPSDVPDLNPVLSLPQKIITIGGGACAVATARPNPFAITASAYNEPPGYVRIMVGMGDSGILTPIAGNDITVHPFFLMEFIGTDGINYMEIPALYPPYTYVSPVPAWVPAPSLPADEVPTNNGTFLPKFSNIRAFYSCRFPRRDNWGAGLSGENILFCNAIDLFSALQNTNNATADPMGHRHYLYYFGNCYWDQPPAVTTNPNYRNVSTETFYGAGAGISPGVTSVLGRAYNVSVLPNSITALSTWMMTWGGLLTSHGDLLINFRGTSLSTGAFQNRMIVTLIPDAVSPSLSDRSSASPAPVLSINNSTWWTTGYNRVAFMYEDPSNGYIYYVYCPDGLSYKCRVCTTPDNPVAGSFGAETNFTDIPLDLDIYGNISALTLSTGNVILSYIHKEPGSTGIWYLTCFYGIKSPSGITRWKKAERIISYNGNEENNFLPTQGFRRLYTRECLRKAPAVQIGNSGDIIIYFVGDPAVDSDPTYIYACKVSLE